MMNERAGKRHFDVAVVGAGAGGLVVASVGAQLGLSVLLVERGLMGGDCLNFGCVPSKALLAAGHAAHLARTMEIFGLHAQNVQVDHAKVRDHVKGVIETISHHDSEERFTALGCTVVRGSARFVSRKAIEIDGERYSARRFVVATGSHAFVPPIKGLEDVPYLTNETVFDHGAPIEHLVVIGGGAIGCEMAQAWRRLGSRVTIIEGLSLLGKDDPEAVQVLRDALVHEGIEIYEKTSVLEVRRKGDMVDVVCSPGLEGEKEPPRTLQGTHLLIAVGRRPNVESLDLDKAGVSWSSAGIQVNDRLRTANRRIYAIGDCIGGMMFTHVAGYEAGIVIGSTMFRVPRKVNYEAIPWVTFTDPELAHVGITAEMAQKKLGMGHFRILRWGFNENDRAQTERATNGAIKVVVSRRGVVLGATIVGPHAGELIVPWVMAVTLKQKIGAFVGSVFPYPVLSEVSKRLASSYYSSSLFAPRTKRLVRLLRWLP